MKKININFIKIIFNSIFLSVPLFLSFFLFINVSNAVEFLENEILGSYCNVSYSWDKSSNWNGLGYSLINMHNIIKDYVVNNSNENAYNTLISNIHNNNYNIVIFNDSTFILLPLNSSVGFANRNSDSMVFVCTENSTSSYAVVWDYFDPDYPLSSKINSSSLHSNAYFQNNVNYLLGTVVYSDVPVYNIVWDGNYSYFWDGTYYYQSQTEPDSPSLPSNAEITQAVQSFYNSDYYKNNKDFSDFIVLYNYETQYFDFIGHDFGIDLGQVIIPPDYEYEGYSYKQDWWKFFLRNIGSQIASNLWNRYYWLYSTNDFGKTITSVGKGSIKDLIDLHFSTKSIIVYSTTDYPVVKIETDENGALSPVEGTIPGNKYTYNENLNPTTNEYNPLKDFVPPSPVDSALGNFNSSDILDIVNQNIISWSEMAWVFTSVSSMFNIFSGFILLICVLLLISKIIGG